ADPLEAYFAETFSSMSNYQNYKHVLGPDRLNAVKIGDSYHIYRSAYVYNISFVESADQTIPENKKIFNEMLNSFRFLPVDGELDNLSDSAETAQVEPLEENEERSDSNPGSQVPVALDNMTYFESLPYKFSAAYPNGWYYAGSRGSSGGILHHYAISDEPIEDVDGIISLDIVGDGVPGSALPYREYGDLVVYKSSGFGDVSFYAELGGHTYHVYGPLEYSETVELITLSITSTE
ncbi:hypothetical protein KJ632_05620, partial [Patescibacteria group bacterium]|nr:hypothetical protein [Patescibacteria group bacterium]